MAIKNLAKEFYSRLLLSVQEWLNFTKAIAVITLICFIISSVCGQAISSVLETKRNLKQFSQIFDEFLIPHTAGRITEAKYFGSKSVVINLQDLHCHPEVQRNISKILSILDEKYKLPKIYLEGAVGNVDTSWLSAISDIELKQKIVESLVDQGKLTGAEYYSVKSKRPEIISGIENKEAYFSNLSRLGKILEARDSINSVLSDLGGELKTLKEAYYNPKQKRLESLTLKYKQGTVDPKKYYKILEKYSRSLDVNIYGYKNVIGYLALIDFEKLLNYKGVTNELQEFLVILNQKLPRKAFELLRTRTDNFTKLDELYVFLIKMSRDFNLNLTANFPNLTRFFQYIELSRRVNPLELVREEKKLLREINLRLCENQGEREIVFLVDFFRHFEDYFGNKISADDYEYFAANLAQFKLLWAKYAENDQLFPLEPHFKLLNEFYRINIERNDWFIKNILDKNNPPVSPFAKGGSNFSASPIDKGGSSLATSPFEKGGVEGDLNTNDTEKTIESLKDAQEIKVVITGGFHTPGLKKLLEEKGISYLVITPNVTESTKISDIVYNRLAKEQSKIWYQTFALPDLSQSLPIENVKAMIFPTLPILLTNNSKLSLEEIKNKYNDIFKEVAKRRKVKEILCNISEYEGGKYLITSRITTKIYDEEYPVFRYFIYDPAKYNPNDASEAYYDKEEAEASGVPAQTTVNLSAPNRLWMAIVVGSAMAVLGAAGIISIIGTRFYMWERYYIKKAQIMAKRNDKNEIEIDDAKKDKVLQEIAQRMDIEDEDFQKKIEEGKIIIDKTAKNPMGFDNNGNFVINPGFVDKLIEVTPQWLVQAYFNHEKRHIKFKVKHPSISPSLEEFIVSLGDMSDAFAILRGKPLNKQNVVIPAVEKPEQEEPLQRTPAEEIGKPIFIENVKELEEFLKEKSSNNIEIKYLPFFRTRKTETFVSISEFIVQVNDLEWAEGTKFLVNTKIDNRGKIIFSVLTYEAGREQKESSKGPAEIKLYHYTTAKDAASIARNGYFDLPGRWTFYTAPEKNAKILRNILRLTHRAASGTNDQSPLFLVFQADRNKILIQPNGEQAALVYNEDSAAQLPDGIDVPDFLRDASKAGMLQKLGSETINIKETIDLNVELGMYKREDVENILGIEKSEIKSEKTKTPDEIKQISEIDPNQIRISETKQAIENIKSKYQDLSAKLEFSDALLKYRIITLESHADQLARFGIPIDNITITYNPETLNKRKELLIKYGLPITTKNLQLNEEKIYYLALEKIHIDFRNELHWVRYDALLRHFSLIKIQPDLVLNEEGKRRIFKLLKDYDEDVRGAALKNLMLMIPKDSALEQYLSLSKDEQWELNSIVADFYKTKVKAIGPKVWQNWAPKIPKERLRMKNENSDMSDKEIDEKITSQILGEISEKAQEDLRLNLTELKLNFLKDKFRRENPLLSENEQDRIIGEMNDKLDIISDYVDRLRNDESPRYLMNSSLNSIIEMAEGEGLNVLTVPLVKEILSRHRDDSTGMVIAELQNVLGYSVKQGADPTFGYWLERVVNNGLSKEELVSEMQKAYDTFLNDIEEIARVSEEDIRWQNWVDTKAKQLNLEDRVLLSAISQIKEGLARGKSIAPEALPIYDLLKQEVSENKNVSAIIGEIIEANGKFIVSNRSGWMGNIRLITGKSIETIEQEMDKAKSAYKAQQEDAKQKLELRQKGLIYQIGRFLSAIFDNVSEFIFVTIKRLPFYNFLSYLFNKVISSPVKRLASIGVPVAMLLIYFSNIIVLASAFHPQVVPDVPITQTTEPADYQDVSSLFGSTGYSLKDVLSQSQYAQTSTDDNAKIDSKAVSISDTKEPDAIIVSEPMNKDTLIKAINKRGISIVSRGQTPDLSDLQIINMVLDTMPDNLKLPSEIIFAGEEQSKLPTSLSGRPGAYYEGKIYLDKTKYDILGLDETFIHELGHSVSESKFNYKQEESFKEIWGDNFLSEQGRASIEDFASAFVDYFGLTVARVDATEVDQLKNIIKTEFLADLFKHYNSENNLTTYVYHYHQGRDSITRSQVALTQQEVNGKKYWLPDFNRVFEKKIFVSNRNYSEGVNDFIETFRHSDGVKKTAAFDSILKTLKDGNASVSQKEKMIPVFMQGAHGRLNDEMTLNSLEALKIMFNDPQVNASQKQKMGEQLLHYVEFGTSYPDVNASIFKETNSSAAKKVFDLLLAIAENPKLKSEIFKKIPEVVKNPETDISAFVAPKTEPQKVDAKKTVPQKSIIAGEQDISSNLKAPWIGDAYLERAPDTYGYEYVGYDTYRKLILNDDGTAKKDNFGNKVFDYIIKIKHNNNEELWRPKFQTYLERRVDIALETPFSPGMLTPIWDRDDNPAEHKKYYEPGELFLKKGVTTELREDGNVIVTYKHKDGDFEVTEKLMHTPSADVPMKMRQADETDSAILIEMPVFGLDDYLQYAQDEGDLMKKEITNPDGTVTSDYIKVEKDRDGNIKKIYRVYLGVNLKARVDALAAKGDLTFIKTSFKGKEVRDKTLEGIYEHIEKSYTDLGLYMRQDDGEILKVEKDGTVYELLLRSPESVMKRIDKEIGGEKRAIPLIESINTHIEEKEEDGNKYIKYKEDNKVYEYVHLGNDVYVRSDNKGVIKKKDGKYLSWSIDEDLLNVRKADLFVDPSNVYKALGAIPDALYMEFGKFYKIYDVQALLNMTGAKFDVDEKGKVIVKIPGQDNLYTIDPPLATKRLKAQLEAHNKGGLVPTLIPNENFKPPLDESKGHLYYKNIGKGGVFKAKIVKNETIAWDYIKVIDTEQYQYFIPAKTINESKKGFGVAHPALDGDIKPNTEYDNFLVKDLDDNMIEPDSIKQEKDGTVKFKIRGIDLPYTFTAGEMQKKILEDPDELAKVQVKNEIVNRAVKAAQLWHIIKNDPQLIKWLNDNFESLQKNPLPSKTTGLTDEESQNAYSFLYTQLFDESKDGKPVTTKAYESYEGSVETVKDLKALQKGSDVYDKPVIIEDKFGNKKKFNLIEYMNENFSALKWNPLPTGDKKLNTGNVKFWFTQLYGEEYEEKEVNGSVMLVKTEKTVKTDFYNDPEKAAISFSHFFNFWDYVKPEKELIRQLNEYESDLQDTVDENGNIIYRQLPIEDDEGLSTENIKYLYKHMYKEKTTEKYVLEGYKFVRKQFKLQGTETTQAWKDPKEYVNGLKKRMNFIKEMRASNQTVLKPDAVSALKRSSAINIGKEGPVPPEVSKKLDEMLYLPKGPEVSKDGLPLKDTKMFIVNLLHSDVLRNPAAILTTFGPIAFTISLSYWIHVKFFIKRRKNVNEISRNELLKALNLPAVKRDEKKAVTASRTADKLLVFRKINGELPELSGDELKNYLSLFMEREEIELILEAINNGALSIKTAESSYDDGRDIPSVERIAEIIEDNPAIDVKGLSEILKKEFVRSENPHFRSIVYFIERELITTGELEEVISGRYHKDNSKSFLEEVYFQSKKAIEFKLLSRITKGEISADMLNEYHPAADVLLLKHILQKNIVSAVEITEIARKLKSPDLHSFVEKLFEDRIVKPMFDRVSDSFPDNFKNIYSELGEDFTKTLYENTFDHIQKAVFKNPTLLQKDDISLEDTNPSVEPATYREELIRRMLCLNPTYTQKHSFGLTGAVWPMLMYLTKKMDSIIVSDREDKKEHIKDILGKTTQLFNRIIKQQNGPALAAITKREEFDARPDELRNKLLDTDLMLLFVLLAESEVDINCLTADKAKYFEKTLDRLDVRWNANTGIFYVEDETGIRNEKTINLVELIEKRLTKEIVKVDEKYIGDERARLRKLRNEYNTKKNAIYARGEPTKDEIRELSGSEIMLNEATRILDSHDKKADAERIRLWAPYIKAIKADSIRLLVSQYPEIKGLEDLAAPEYTRQESILEKLGIKSVVFSKSNVDFPLLIKRLENYEKNKNGDYACVPIIKILEENGIKERNDENIENILKAINGALDKKDLHEMLRVDELDLYPGMRKLYNRLRSGEELSEKELRLVNRAIFIAKFPRIFRMEKSPVQIVFDELYLKRMLKPVISLSFWGIKDKKSLAKFAVLTAGFFVLAGLSIMFLPAVINLNIALTFFSLGLIMPRLIVGQTLEPSTKGFFMNIAVVFSIYWAGILGTFFIRGIPVSILMSGIWAVPTMFITGGVLFLVAVPTLMSIWHLASAERAFSIISQQEGSKTGKRINLGIRLGKWGFILFLIGGIAYAGGFAYGLPLAILGIAIVILVQVLFGDIHTKSGWGRTFKIWYKEFYDSSVTLPNGETAKEYLEILIDGLERKGHLSKVERDNWKNALNNPEQGDFVMPESEVAKKYIRDAFFSISKKKPSVDDLVRIQTMTTNVNCFGENFRFKFEIIRLNGSLQIKSKKNLLGYIARKNQPEWRNMIDYVKQNIVSTDKESDDKKISDFVQSLSLGPDFFNESTEINVPDLKSAAGKKKFGQIVKEIENLVNELLPSNYNVVESMHREHIEWHKYFAYQLCDYEYFAAVRQISQEYDSLKDAYESISSKTKIDRNEEKVFLEKYKEYQEKARRQHRLIYNDEAIYYKGGVKLTKDGKIENFPAMSDFVKYIKDIGLFDTMKIGDESFKDMDIFNDTRNIHIREWARKFVEFRENNVSEIAKIIEDCPMPSGKSEIGEKWNKICKIADSFVETERFNVEITYYDSDNQTVANNKNAAFALNLWKFVGKIDSHDTFVRILPGQNVFTLNLASLLGNSPRVAVVNPAMRIHGTQNFPVTFAYAIGQEAWSFVVQLAHSGRLTFYGKGTIIPQMVSSFAPPGEDSSAFLFLWAVIGRKNIAKISETPKKFQAIHCSWRIWEWGRAALLRESIIATEKRYAFNVSRFLMDIYNYLGFIRSENEYDTKLTHLFLWTHYLGVPFVLFIGLALSAFVLFSSYAYLLPYVAATFISFFLMEAIQMADTVRNSRDSGSFMWGVYLTLKDMYKGFFLWVSMIAIGWLGIIDAVGKEIFRFIRTEKELKFEKYGVSERYYDGDVGRYLARWGFRGVVATGIFTVLFIFLNVVIFSGTVNLLTGSAIVFWYALFAVANVGGYNVFRMVERENNLIEGQSAKWIFWLGNTFILLSTGILFLMILDATSLMFGGVTPFKDLLIKIEKWAHERELSWFGIKVRVGESFPFLFNFNRQYQENLKSFTSRPRVFINKARNLFLKPEETKPNKLLYRVLAIAISAAGVLFVGIFFRSFLLRLISVIGRMIYEVPILETIYLILKSIFFVEVGGIIVQIIWRAIFTVSWYESKLSTVHFYDERVKAAKKLGEFKGKNRDKAIKVLIDALERLEPRPLLRNEEFNYKTYVETCLDSLKKLKAGDEKKVILYGNLLRSKNSDAQDVSIDRMKRFHNPELIGVLISILKGKKLDSEKNLNFIVAASDSLAKSIGKLSIEAEKTRETANNAEILRNFSAQIQQYADFFKKKRDNNTAFLGDKVIVEAYEIENQVIVKEPSEKLEKEWVKFLGDIRQIDEEIKRLKVKTLEEESVSETNGITSEKEQQKGQPPKDENGEIKSKKGIFSIRNIFKAVMVPGAVVLLLAAHRASGNSFEQDIRNYNFITGPVGMIILLILLLQVIKLLKYAVSKVNALHRFLFPVDWCIREIEDRRIFDLDKWAGFGYEKDPVKAIRMLGKLSLKGKDKEKAVKFLLSIVYDKDDGEQIQAAADSLFLKEALKDEISNACLNDKFRKFLESDIDDKGKIPWEYLVRFRILGKSGGKLAQELLLQVLRESKEYNLLRLSNDALLEMGAPRDRIYEVVKNRFLSKRDPQKTGNRRLLTDVLGQVGDSQIIESLLKELIEYPDLNTLDALANLGAVNQPVVQKEVRKLIYAKDWNVRDSAFEALRKINALSEEEIINKCELDLEDRKIPEYQKVDKYYRAKRYNRAIDVLSTIHTERTKKIFFEIMLKTDSQDELSELAKKLDAMEVPKKELFALYKEYFYVRNDRGDIPSSYDFVINSIIKLNLRDKETKDILIKIIRGTGNYYLGWWHTFGESIERAVDSIINTGDIEYINKAIKELEKVYSWYENSKKEKEFEYKHGLYGTGEYLEILKCIEKLKNAKEKIETSTSQSNTKRLFSALILPALFWLTFLQFIRVASGMPLDGYAGEVNIGLNTVLSAIGILGLLVYSVKNILPNMPRRKNGKNEKFLGSHKIKITKDLSQTAAKKNIPRKIDWIQVINFSNPIRFMTNLTKESYNAVMNKNWKWLKDNAKELIGKSFVYVSKKPDWQKIINLGEMGINAVCITAAKEKPPGEAVDNVILPLKDEDRIVSAYIEEAVINDEKGNLIGKRPYLILYDTKRKVGSAQELEAIDADIVLGLGAIELLKGIYERRPLRELLSSNGLDINKADILEYDSSGVFANYKLYNNPYYAQVFENTSVVFDYDKDEEISAEELGKVRDIKKVYIKDTGKVSKTELGIRTADETIGDKELKKKQPDMGGLIFDKSIYGNFIEKLKGIVLNVYQVGVKIKSSAGITRSLPGMGGSVLASALRDDSQKDDFGIGKLTFMWKHLTRELLPKGISIMPLLPFNDPKSESLFAGDTLLINWAKVIQDLLKKDINSYKLFAPVDSNENEVDRNDVKSREFIAANEIYKELKDNKEFVEFLNENKDWLNSYAEKMAQEKLPGIENIGYPTQIELYKFMQWIFYTQLRESIVDVHKAGGKLLFTITINENNKDDALKAMSFMFNKGFDGVQLNLEGSKLDVEYIKELDKIINQARDPIVVVSLDKNISKEVQKEIHRIGYNTAMKISITEENIPIDSSQDAANRFYEIVKKAIEKTSGISKPFAIFPLGSLWGENNVDLAKNPNYRMPREGDMVRRKLGLEFARKFSEKLLRLCEETETPESTAEKAYNEGYNFKETVPDEEWLKINNEINKLTVGDDEVSGRGFHCLFAAQEKMITDKIAGKEAEAYYVENIFFEAAVKIIKTLEIRSVELECVKRRITQMQEAAKNADKEHRLIYNVWLFNYLRGISVSRLESRFTAVRKAVPFDKTERKMLGSVLLIADSLGIRVEELAKIGKREYKHISTEPNIINLYEYLLDEKTLNQNILTTEYNRQNKTFEESIFILQVLEKAKGDLSGERFKSEIYPVLNPLLNKILKTGALPTGVEESQKWAITELFRIYMPLIDWNKISPIDETKDMFKNMIEQQKAMMSAA